MYTRLGTIAPEVMNMDEYRIIVCDLPPGVNGCIVKVEDFCTILVSSRLTYEEQRKAAKHELMHFNLGHMDDYDTPVMVKENEIKHPPIKAGAGVDVINRN